MDLSRQPNSPQPPQPPDFNSDNSSVAVGMVPSDTKVPKQFTSQGTTPSGKPRLFVCAMCTRAFARLEHLRRHERSHTKEKPFDCGVCQRKFSRRDLLLRHAQKLHAGCDDAVARMRRRSSKSNANSTNSALSATATSASQNTDSGSGSSGGTRSAGSTQGSSNKGNLFLSPQAGSQEHVNFNLNAFGGRTQGPSNSPVTPSSRMSRSNSVKESSLKKQLFERRKPEFRRASFSAQSGPNYAMVPPQLYDASTAENVEFSTPQFLPTFTSDEDSWLSNLCTIPGMSPQPQQHHQSQHQHQQQYELKPQQMFNEQHQAYSLDREFPKNSPIFVGGMHAGVIRSDSVGSTTSVSNIDTPGANPPLTSSRSSFVVSGPAAQSEHVFNTKSDLDETGYSFYDIPESWMSRSITTSSIARPLSPIRQELEDELMELETPDQFVLKTEPTSRHIISDSNFNHEHVNDLDDLDQFFKDSGKKLLGGYSFYGDNPSLPSTGLESMSSHTSASPSNIQTANPQLLGNNSYMNGSRFDTDSHIPLEDQFKNATLFEQGFSCSALFTKNMRLIIKKALNKYPISDVMPPSIPSNDKLEFFTRTFVERFLSYFPFIHPSRLNEHDIMDMASDEDPSNESARICLPLLVATWGALLSGNKKDSEQLYEASRRSVHIYLDSRKSGKSDKSTSLGSSLSNPLWLIQSLTLSVMYGLFSDSEHNVYNVIRQLNALNSLVKTSLKNNHELFFTVNGQEQIINTCARKGNWHKACELINCGNEEEIKFKHALSMQSQVRSAFTIYQLTNFILMSFNVPLTLSASEFGTLACPNIHDEFLWGFNNYYEFTEFLQNRGIHRDLDYYLSRDESNTIVFRDILKSICQNELDTSVSSKLMNLSQFGFNCLIKGIYEFMQYDEYKFMDMTVVLNYITAFVCSSSRNTHTNYLTINRNWNEKFDFAFLVNFVKICSIIDLKMVKEQCWLTNYDVLNKNYHILLTGMDTINYFDYLTVIDCCIAIAKLVIFKMEGSDIKFEDENGGFHTEGVRMDNNTSAVTRSDDNFENHIGLKVLDEISFTTSPIHSQVVFHIFVIFSIFAVYIAKRNNPSSGIAQSRDMNDSWQLNQKFITILKILAKFEEYLRIQFKNHQLGTEMSNLFVSLWGNNNDMFQDQEGFSEEHNNVFAYSLDKAVYMLRIGELMIRILYEQNIKVVIFKKLSNSMSQIRKYLVDEESSFLP
ncbi:hypothetical protein JCM33374_g5285 [Metschnikowia sp. JCM 33374]|nr:hypothetical protein JCM33374_g5285 [Metschnikowia sp. JCM 33374]